MKSEFDYGEVIDNIDMINAYGDNNGAPVDPLSDNMVGVGMPIPSTSPAPAVPDEAMVRKMTNVKIAVILLVIGVLLYLAYKRGQDSGSRKKRNPLPRPQAEPLTDEWDREMEQTPEDDSEDDDDE